MIARLVVVAWLCAGLAATQQSFAQPPPEQDSVVVASKKFPESVLLSELLAQGLEQRGLRVERRFNLGNTAVAYAALQQGSVDVYPEYSGSALGLLGIDRSKLRPDEVTAWVRRSLEPRGLHWGPALGFDNSYGVAVRPDFARAHSIDTLSDLASFSRKNHLVAAFTHEFLSREDGYRPLARHYGLSASTRATEHAVAYQLLGDRQVDAIDVYTTEGLIAQYGLVVLEDDKGFFPPYQAGYIYGPRLARSAPALAALIELSNALSNTKMRELNRKLEVQGLPAEQVARSFREHWLGAHGSGDAESASLQMGRRQLGFFALLAHDRHALVGHLERHLALTLLAMLLCVLVGVPLGYLASRSQLGATLGLGLSGALQTIPSLALLVLAIPVVAALLTPLGEKNLVLEGAALLALFLYSLLPVVRNTKQGLEGIDPAILDAARGTGMTDRQLLAWVELPLALPVILAGVRTAFVITIGTATLAAFVGAGGLGVPIISGLSVQNFTEVWTGAVPAALLALGSDAGFALLQHRLTRNIGGKASTSLTGKPTKQ